MARKQTGVRKTPAGTWSVDFRDPLRVKRRKTFDLERDAIEFRERVKTNIRDGEYVGPLKWTLSQGAEMLLKKKANKRPQTIAQLRLHTEKYIKPALGQMLMTGVTFEDFERAGDEWSKKLAAPTVNKLYTTISAIYKAMRRHGVRNNPVSEVERKHKPAVADEEEETGRLRPIRTEEVYSADEVCRLIDGSKPGRDRALHMTACLTGLRHGELNGLQWPCVDLKEGRITVRRSLTEIPQAEGGPILEPPKTRAGYRKFKIPAELVSELRKWKLACPSSHLDLVFPNELGEPVTRKSNERKLKRAMKNAKIRPLSMNNLRHTFASQHLAEGTPVAEIATMMGHSSTKITLEVYTHWARNEDSGSQTRLAERIFNGPKVAQSRHEDS